MPDQDDPSASFDPRTWHPKGPEAPQEPRAADPGSFDPKTWARGSEGEEGGGPAPPAFGRAPAGGRYRNAIAAGAAILIAGAAATWLWRPAPPPEPGAAAAAPASARPGADDGPAESRRTIMLENGGRIAAALTAAGVDGETARRAARQAGPLLGDIPGEVRLAFDLAETGGGSRLTWLEATRADGSGARLVAAGNGLRAERLDARLTTTIHAVAGEMDDNSFYTSAVTAGVTDSLISDFAAAFSFDLDFQREVRRGDRFEAVFEQPRNPSGQAVGAARLLFVSMRTSDKSLRFYRFRPPGGEQAWFDDNGRSNVRSLMRTPVDGARVTSRFGMRVHPILGYQRLHRGTDFAAPTGTPIYASGNAQVEFAQPRGAAGNMVRLRHDNGWFTHYFHLSAFAPGLGPGTRVSQGQAIGLVGTTGRSTGPHLHYEVWIDGAPVDSQSIDTGTGTTLQGAALQAFNAERDRIDRARANAGR